MEKHFKLANLYDMDNTNLVHCLNQALKANYGFKKDVDYGESVLLGNIDNNFVKRRNFNGLGYRSYY